MDVQKKIKRLERICLILIVCVLLLGIFSIAIAWNFWRVVQVLGFFSDQFDLIRQHIDTIPNVV